MAAITFSYRSKKEIACLEVRLSYSTNEKRYSIYERSKIKVSKEYWNNLHSKTDFPNYRDVKKKNKVKEILKKQIEVNSHKNKLRDFILNEFDKIPLENQHDISKEWLRNTITLFYNPIKKSKAPEQLLDYFDYYIKERDLKPRTVKKILVVKHRIEKHLNLFKYNRPILMSDIDDEFKRRLENAFKDYSKNSINGSLKEIKTLCRHARKKGMDINDEVFNWELKYTKPNIVYLNNEELEAIQNLESLPLYLDNARDWLLISCMTGQRVSDFMRFDKSMIRNEKNRIGKEIPLIEFTQEKTEKMIAVPLQNGVLTILKKRNGNFPNHISKQRYNEYIKEVCRIAGITEPTKGSKKTMVAKGKYRQLEGVYPKYELVTSHIGRRSFASNFFGVIPNSLIMSATGHTKESQFLAYVGKSQTEQAKGLADYF